MDARFAKFFARRSTRREMLWRRRPDFARVRTVVAIPAMAESDSLPATLHSLATCAEAELARTLVVVVVNRPTKAEPAVERDNHHTLSWLAEKGSRWLPNLCWIDATSPGRQLPGRGGVGLARAIAADSVLARLFETLGERAISIVLAHLDADTTVEETYLSTLTSLPGGRTSAVVPFAHAAASRPDAQRAIDRYELYVRTIVQGLRWAGSPYAFHTVGSTMAGTAEAYVLAGGMPQKRLAGEDFYFLQACAKIGVVKSLTGTTVHPSPRISNRVPFGTGPHMAAALAKGDDETLAPDPVAFAELKQLLENLRAAAEHRPSAIGEWLADGAEPPSPAAGIADVWPSLLRHCPTPYRLLVETHRWFDALASIRFIRQRGERDTPPLPVERAWKELMKRTRQPVDDDASTEALLAQARTLQTTDECRGLLALPESTTDVGVAMTPDTGRRTPGRPLSAVILR